MQRRIHLERANVQIKDKNPTPLFPSSCNISAGAVINIDFEIVCMHVLTICVLTV